MKNRLLRSLLTLFVGLALLLPGRAQAAAAVPQAAAISCSVQVTGIKCVIDTIQLNVSWNSGGG